MPYDYKFNKGKGKDIELPAEGRRDPRLPAKKTSSLDALKGIAGKVKSDTEKLKRMGR